VQLDELIRKTMKKRHQKNSTHNTEKEATTDTPTLYRQVEPSPR
jgi:hypothetical protein